ncbi:MAG: hypothetical protein ACLU6B_02600 [Lachnospirales bacterium]
MTLREFCRESGLSKRMVRSFIRKGRIQPKRSGFRYDFTLTDMQRAYANSVPSEDSLEPVRPIEPLYASQARTAASSASPAPGQKNDHLTSEERVMKNVRSQTSFRHLKYGLIIAAILLLIGLFVWTNFRTITRDFTVSEGTLVLSNMKPNHGSYYKLTQSGDELPQTFYVRSDLDIPLDENGEYHFSQVKISVRVPARIALEDPSRNIGPLLNTEVLTHAQKNSLFSTEYMEYIYVTEITE